VNTNTYIYIYKTNPSISNKEDERKEKNKELDIEQIYGHGSQRGPIPGVSVPAGCQQLASASAFSTVQFQMTGVSLPDEEN
jgi:hypothetical protein